MTQATETLRAGTETTPRPTEENVTSICTPAIDIAEHQADVVLTVDLPGVDEKSLDLAVESGLLTIEARAVPEEPAGFERVGGEYGPVRYRRTVRLSDRLNTGGIAAQLRQGVLRVTIPKREETKARRVTIAAG